MLWRSWDRSARSFFGALSEGVNSNNTAHVSTAETDRLVIRSPLESDRSRFVELFTDSSFTLLSGVRDVESANARFDQMLAWAGAIPYAKQPVIERETGTIVGYTGVVS